MRGLVDTSVLVGLEQGREVTDVPDEIAISAMTLGELHLGVLTAKNAATRAVRLRTLSELEGYADTLPIDGKVARVFADLIAEGREAGLRFPVADALIAATAVANDLPLFTQDAVFETMPGVQSILV